MILLADSPGGSATLLADDGRLQRLLELLARVNEELQLESVLGAVIEGARQLLGADTALIYQRGAGGDIVCPVLTDVPPGALQATCQACAVAGLCGRAGLPSARPFVPALLERARETPVAAPHPTAPGGTLLAVPMRRRGQVVGHLLLEHVTPVTYRAADLQLVEVLATQAAQAIEHARLYRAAQAREQEVRALNAALEERVRERTAALAAAIQDLEAFNASVSHDLRNPLQALSGYTQILLQKHAGGLPADAVVALRRMQDRIAQIGRVLDGLLALSRANQQPLRRQPVAVADLVRQVWADLIEEAETAPAAQPELALRQLPSAQADATLLRQVFANLLGNALKFARPRARVRVEVGCREDRGEAVYYVRDNGVGFSMQDAGPLFGAFQRLPGSDGFDGTGVGLALVQRIVRRHGGQIWAEAAPGRGATFFFTLGPAPEPSPDGMPPLPAARSGSERSGAPVAYG